MCPGKELLSSYVDEELSTEEKQRIELHLKKCTICTLTVRSYIRLRESLRKGVEEAIDIEAIADRVSMALRRYRRFPRPFWRRKVQVRWAAAAATFFFILGVGLSQTLFRPRSLENIPILDTQPSLNVTINVKSMEQLLDILNRQQGIREITIELPQIPQFEFRSEPVFIRASDYNRSAFR